MSVCRRVPLRRRAGRGFALGAALLAFGTSEPEAEALSCVGVNQEWMDLELESVSHDGVVQNNLPDYVAWTATLRAGFEADVVMFEAVAGQNDYFSAEFRADR